MIVLKMLFLERSALNCHIQVSEVVKKHHRLWSCHLAEKPFLVQILHFLLHSFTKWYYTASLLHLFCCCLLQLRHRQHHCTISTPNKFWGSAAFNALHWGMRIVNTKKAKLAYFRGVLYRCHAAFRPKSRRAANVTYLKWILHANVPTSSICCADLSGTMAQNLWWHHSMISLNSCHWL